MNSFRVILDAEADGRRNMAIDEAMLRRANDCPDPVTTLRLYLWEPAAVSLGYAQNPEKAVRFDFCRQQGIDVVRRPTGGRAVLHDRELTYSVVSNELEAFGGSGILDCYLVIARALHGALAAIGCPARISPGSRKRKDSLPSPMDAPCFVSTSRYEITAGGRKLIGSAQRRLKRSFLQHGSILIDCDFARQAAALGTTEEEIRSSFAGILDFLPGSSSVEGLRRDLRQAMVASFEKILAAPSRPEPLDPEEILLADRFLEEGTHHIPAA